MRAAARVYVDSGLQRGAATFGQIEVVARRLATTPAPARDRVTHAFRQYATKLQLIGLRTRELAPRGVSTGRLAAVDRRVGVPRPAGRCGNADPPACAPARARRDWRGAIDGDEGNRPLARRPVRRSADVDHRRRVARRRLRRRGGGRARCRWRSSRPSPVWTPLTRLVATLWGYLPPPIALGSCHLFSPHGPTSWRPSTPP